MKTGMVDGMSAVDDLADFGFDEAGLERRFFTPNWLKRVAVWFYCATHEDELSSAAFYVRWCLKPPLLQRYKRPVDMDVSEVRGVRERRLRAIGAMDVMTILGLGGK